MPDSQKLIQHLDQTLNTFRTNVSVKINDLDSCSLKIRQTANMIHENIDRLKGNMMQNEEKHIAYENILRLDQLIKDRFGHYEAIRKTVMGVVRDFDINLVRNSTIQELSEELWITSSRYWLSYALIAITGWVNNYPDVARNAISESLRKDSHKTALFFCLMNLRFKREDAARQWFFTYFEGLDPSDLTQETAVLLEAFLHGVFGRDPSIERQVSKLVDDWIVSIGRDATVGGDVFAAYTEYITALPSHAENPCELLSKCCVQYDAVISVYKELSKYDSLIALLESLNQDTDPLTRDGGREDIDRLLVHLITKYDEEEQALLEQQEYYRYVVDNDGMVENARTQFDARQKLMNGQFNIGRHMMKWALYDDDRQTDIHVRKFGLCATKYWFSKALHNWTSGTEASVPREFELRIDEFSLTSDGDDLEEQKKRLRTHFRLNRFRCTVGNKLNAAACVVFAIAAGLTFIHIYAAAGMILSALFLLIRLIVSFTKYSKRRKKAFKTLLGCMEQIASFRQYCEDSEQKKAHLLNMLGYM